MSLKQNFNSKYNKIKSVIKGLYIKHFFFDLWNNTNHVICETIIQIFPLF